MFSCGSRSTLGIGSRVTVQEIISEWGKVTGGVPLGLALGPVLFLVYVNNILDGTKSGLSICCWFITNEENSNMWMWRGCEKIWTNCRVGQMVAWIQPQ